MYIEAGQLDLDITRNFLDLESFRSVYAENECFYVSMPKFNLDALKEDSERTCRSAKSAESALSNREFTLAYYRSGIRYDATALTPCDFTFALSNTIRSPQLDVCGKLCKRFNFYPKGTLIVVKGINKKENKISTVIPILQGIQKVKSYSKAI